MMLAPFGVQAKRNSNMQYFNIKKEVYVVEGLKKSCVYDCQGNKHYWIEKDISDFLHRLTNRETTKQDDEYIASCIELGLIEETQDEAPQSWPNIKELFKFPRHMDYAWIEITNQCNLRCTHCYNETAQRIKKQLSYDDFTHVVDELVRFGIKAVQLIGGEPFVVKEETLFKMIDYASKSFDEIELFFNGTLTTKEHLQRIKDNYSNCKIALSLHSFIKEQHEKITKVEGSYEKTVITLRNLKELGIPFRYVGIYSADIEVGEEMDFGVPYRRDYIRLTGRGNLSHYNKQLLKEKLITLDTFKFDNLKETLKSTYSECCFANYIYVGSDMNVYPCVMERRLCHGNLKDHALTEVLDKELVNYSKDNVLECKDCEFRHLCKDCRPDSLSMIVNDKPWYCTYDVKNGIWANIDDFIDNLLNNYQQ